MLLDWKGAVETGNAVTKESITAARAYAIVA
jgi:hypothetical protein